MTDDGTAPVFHHDDHEPSVIRTEAVGIGLDKPAATAVVMTDQKLLSELAPGEETAVFETGRERAVKDAAETFTVMLRCSSTAKETKLPAYPTRFHSVVKPSQTMHEYVGRLAVYGQCSAACFALAFVYIGKVAHRIAFGPLTGHRLLIAAVLCAVKFLDDEHNVRHNYTWANLGGVPLKELNSLEREFLELVDYQLFVSQEQFEASLKDMARVVHDGQYTHCKG